MPGSGALPPRNAYDIAWSEYNHHWAGLLVAVPSVVLAIASLVLAGVSVPGIPEGIGLVGEALAIAGLAATGPTRIEDADCVAVSYPEFFATLSQVTHAS